MVKQVSQTVASASAFDSSHMQLRIGHGYKQLTRTSGMTTWSPASTFIPGVYAFTDASAEPWFAPAGLVRGALGNVSKSRKKD